MHAKVELGSTLLYSKCMLALQCCAALISALQTTCQSRCLAEALHGFLASRRQRYCPQYAALPDVQLPGVTMVWVLPLQSHIGLSGPLPYTYL